MRVRSRGRDHCVAVVCSRNRFAGDVKLHLNNNVRKVVLDRFASSWVSQYDIRATRKKSESSCYNIVFPHWVMFGEMELNCVELEGFIDVPVMHEAKIGIQCFPMLQRYAA